MKLPTLRIDRDRVLKIENDSAGMCGRSPVGQVFAFHAAPLLDAAGAITRNDLSAHEFLLRMAIEGLWHMRTKHRVLVGYVPGPDDASVIRLCLLARRELPFGNFVATMADQPGYMETGRGHVRESWLTPLAYWEHPCSAYAIWPPSSEGVPFLSSELDCFESKGSRYWMIHREFEFIGVAK